MKASRIGLMINLVITLTTACAGASPPSSTRTTLTSGWEQHLTIDWAAAEQSPNARKVTGYVYNETSERVVSIRVLAQAIDSAGSVVGQRIAYIPGGVGRFGRAYFEVPGLPVAEDYRVSVWDYTIPR